MKQQFQLIQIDFRNRCQSENYSVDSLVFVNTQPHTHWTHSIESSSNILQPCIGISKKHYSYA